MTATSTVWKNLAVHRATQMSVTPRRCGCAYQQRGPLTRSRWTHSGWESLVVRARRGDAEDDRYLDPNVFDLRREERARARTGDGTYETSFNQKLRNRSKLSTPMPINAQEESGSDKSTFVRKVGDAWRIFFPKGKRNFNNMSARDAGKNRLRMILVSDRNSISSEVMEEMKKTIVTALEDYVEIKSDDEVDLSMSTDQNLGTIYSVSVPVRCVRPEKRSYYSEDGIVEDGENLMIADNWDEWDDNPDSRFPWGT